MKILVVCEGYPQTKTSLRGVFAFDQAKALHQLGFDVLLVSIDLQSIRRRRKLGMYWDEKEGVRIVNYSIPLGKFPEKILIFAGKMALIKMYEDIIIHFGKPDLIHAHFTSYANMSVILKKRYNIPLVITEHNSDISKSILSKKLLKLGRETYSYANCLISVSSLLSTKIKHFWGVDSVVVPNIVDTSLFYIDITPKSVDSFTFISVGCLLHRKGFDLLIHAFADANFPENVSLKIVGDGPLRNEMQLEIEKRGLTSRIELIGFQNREEIAKLMKQCDSFVLASRGETFGVVYIEAMAAGLPVIATACGGPEDFVNEQNGILIPTNDVPMLTKSLIDMYKNNHLYDRRYIAENVRQQFAPETIATQLAITYNQVITDANY